MHFRLESAGGEARKSRLERKKWWQREKGTDEDENGNARKEAGQIRGRGQEDRPTVRMREKQSLNEGQRGKWKQEKTEDAPEEHIIWPLPPSGKAANGSG